MKRRMIQFATAATLATGLVLAQAPSSSPTPNPPASSTPNPPATRHHMRRHFMRERIDRLSQELNLTDTQKQQARTIFQSARTTAQPIREQMRKNHQALMQAAKSGQSSSQIQQLSAEQGKLVGKMAAIHTQAFGKFYHSVLTPEQRTKFDQLQQQRHEKMQNRMRQRTTG